MKLNKVYGRAQALHVCFKGAHYQSPNDTKVTPDKRVTVAAESSRDTVLVNGEESWSLKGSYTEKKNKNTVQKNLKSSVHPMPMRQLAMESAITISPENHQAVLLKLKGVAPSEIALGVLEASWTNWCYDRTSPILFQGFNYRDNKDTLAVKELGQELMKQFSVVV